jgi:hypothetical protein
MRFLLEHEAGFDTDRLGFPSINGCHAICFLTQVGLFGFHNAGGSGKEKFDERARLFCDYVKTLSHGALPKGVHLYGCSFVSDGRRGYTVGRTAEEWKAELLAFAKRLRFSGPISGYDLAKWSRDQTRSAYVEYRCLGKRCLIFAKDWSEDHKEMVPNPMGLRHKNIIGRWQPDAVITAVDTTNLSPIVPERIRA